VVIHIDQEVHFKLAGKPSKGTVTRVNWLMLTAGGHNNLTHRTVHAYSEVHAYNVYARLYITA